MREVLLQNIKWKWVHYLQCISSKLAKWKPKEAAQLLQLVLVLRVGLVEKQTSVGFSIIPIHIEEGCLRLCGLPQSINLIAQVNQVTLINHL